MWALSENDWMEFKRIWYGFPFLLIIDFRLVWFITVYFILNKRWTSKSSKRLPQVIYLLNEVLRCIVGQKVVIKGLSAV